MTSEQGACYPAGMRCAQCSRWRRAKSAKEFGAYVPERLGEWGCCAIGVTTGGVPSPTTLAYAEDSESHYAELLTHETFGCVQWEAIY